MAYDVNDIDSGKSSYLEDNKDEGEDATSINALAGYVEQQYKRAEDARYTDENSWIKAYKNYRGVYNSDVQFLETEKSRIFVKVTKTKVLACLLYTSDAADDS